jgi:hypothetical protein
VTSVRRSARHLLTYSPDALRDTGLYKRLELDEWDFLSGLADEDASDVFIAKADGVIVGWMRCTLSGRKNSKKRVLYAQGTWVAIPFRREGLAFKLWEMAIRRHRPVAVSGATVSRGGHRLIQKLKKTHPDIEWSVFGRSRFHRGGM